MKEAALATEGPIVVRRDAARTWVEMARACNHPSTLDAYKMAVDLMDRTVTLSRCLEKQHQKLATDEALQAMRYFAVDAASLAIERGDLEDAVELVERGRSTLLSHLGQYRLPAVDKLRVDHQELADEFFRVSLQLDVMVTTQTAFGEPVAGEDPVAKYALSLSRY